MVSTFQSFVFAENQATIRLVKKNKLTAQFMFLKLLGNIYIYIYIYIYILIYTTY